MKTKTLLLILAATLIVGCKHNQDKAVLVRSTILGFEVTPGGSGSMSPGLRLGLVRNQYLSVPTSTNHVYSAPFYSDTDAKLGVSQQTVVENIKTK